MEAPCENAQVTTNAELNDGERAVVAQAGVTGALEVRPLTGGHRNRVLRVSSGDRSVVVRHWTASPDATAVEVAAVELAALREAHDDGVPVPTVLAEDGPIAVLSFVDGEPASEALPRCTRAQARQLGDAVAGAFRSVWARPRSNAADQWDGAPSEAFADLLDRAVHAPPGWPGFAAGYTEIMDYLLARPVRLHGDANPKNVLVRKENGGYRVTGILDWEFTCAGPAEFDLGNLLRFERQSSVLGPFGKGVVDGSGMSADQVVIARRLDLFAMAELFAREDLASRSPDFLARLFSLAQQQQRADAL